MKEDLVLNNGYKILFTGCLKDNNDFKVNWIDGSIRNITMKSFVFNLNFDENIHSNYKYIIDNNNLEYLKITKFEEFNSSGNYEELW